MKFKIPTRFDSIGTPITVELVDQDLTDNYGKFIPSESKILICSKVPNREQIFWHEFFHSCCAHLGVKLEEEQEEHLCELFAQLVVQMLKTAE